MAGPRSAQQSFLTVMALAALPIVAKLPQLQEHRLRVRRVANIGEDVAQRTYHRRVMQPEEGVDFFVKINNPSEEAFEGRLLVELIGLESNIKLLEEELYLYPGGAYLESLREGVTKEGEYGIRIVLKDSNFENVLEQKLLNFRVVRDCFGRDVCSYEEAYKKCNICRGGSSNTIFWILGGFIGFGTILMLYFDFKRRRLT